jgi:hypothetical protein
MDNENAETLCNHTYESFTLVAKNLVAHYNHNVTLQKIKHS